MNINNLIFAFLHTKIEAKTWGNFAFFFCFLNFSASGKVYGTKRIENFELIMHFSSLVIVCRCFFLCWIEFFKNAKLLSRKKNSLEIFTTLENEVMCNNADKISSIFFFGVRRTVDGKNESFMKHEKMLREIFLLSDWKFLAWHAKLNKKNVWNWVWDEKNIE